MPNQDPLPDDYNPVDERLFAQLVRLAEAGRSGHLKAYYRADGTDYPVDPTDPNANVFVITDD